MVQEFIEYFQLQFTLNVTLKGNKPDFHEAMGPDMSQQFYNTFLDQLRATYKAEKIKGEGKVFSCFVVFYIHCRC